MDVKQYGWIEAYVYSITQIARTPGSTSIRHRSDTFASDRWLIDIDPMVFDIWVEAIHSRRAFWYFLIDITLGLLFYRWFCVSDVEQNIQRRAHTALYVGNAKRRFFEWPEEKDMQHHISYVLYIAYMIIFYHCTENFPAGHFTWPR